MTNLTSRQVADEIGVSQKQIWRYVKQGRVTPLRTSNGGGGRMLFTPDHVAALVKSMQPPEPSTNRRRLHRRQRAA